MCGLADFPGEIKVRKKNLFSYMKSMDFHILSTNIRSDFDVPENFQRKI